MQHLFGQVFHIGIGVRDASPEEHSLLLRVEGTAEGGHDFLGNLATGCIRLDVGVCVPCLRILVCLCSSQLERTESAGVDVALNLQNPLDEGAVGCQHAYTPSGHVVALRHGVELDAALLGPRHLQDAQVLLAVQDERVGVVVHHHDVVLLGERHNLLIEFASGTSASGHVGIVCPHEFHPRQVHCLQLLKVRLPAVALQEVVVHNLLTQNLAQRSVGGVARIRHQHLVARVAQGEGYVQDALLAADEGLNLSGRVEFHPIPTLVESCHRLSQFWDSHRGLIAVGIGLLGILAEHVNRLCTGWHVGRPDGKRDDVLALGIKFGHFLQFSRKVILAHKRESVCWLYHCFIVLFPSLYSPNTFSCLVSGRTASILWR